jgi:hypothetical protein
MEASMRIRFIQSGGFAGLVKTCRIDAAGLDVSERQELESLVAGCGLGESGQRLSDGGRDLRQYEIMIERDGTSLRCVCDDRSLPASARPLVQFLAARARPGMPAAEPDEAWGRFEGSVVARWHDDGREMTLVEPFAYLDRSDLRWDATAGSVVNGASIPRAFWTLIGGPFEGRFRNASVVHDVACVERTRPWQQVHRMFYEACRCGGVDIVKAKTMYYAVAHFGPRWRLDGRTVRDESPPQPTAAQAAAIERWFEEHEVDADAIPSLLIE